MIFILVGPLGKGVCLDGLIKCRPQHGSNFNRGSFREYIKPQQQANMEKKNGNCFWHPPVTYPKLAIFEFRCIVQTIISSIYVEFRGCIPPQKQTQQPIDDPASDHHDSWLRRKKTTPEHPEPTKASPSSIPSQRNDIARTWNQWLEDVGRWHFPVKGSLSLGSMLVSGEGSWTPGDLPMHSWRLGRPKPMTPLEGHCFYAQSHWCRFFE